VFNSSIVSSGGWLSHKAVKPRISQNITEARKEAHASGSMETWGRFAAELSKKPDV